MSTETDNKTTKGEFNTVRNVDDYELINLEIAVANGQLNANQVSKMMNQARTGTAMRESTAEKRKKEDSLRNYIRLMDNIENYADGLEQGLIDKYGEGYRQSILERALTQEEREGLNEDEQLARAYEKYLDEDGNVKPEFENDEVAQDLAKMYELDYARELAKALNENPDDPELISAAERLRETGTQDQISLFNLNCEDITQQSIADEGALVQNNQVQVASIGIDLTRYDGP